MIRTLDSSNSLALEFNRSKQREMKKICSPLRQFGISYFTYIKFFNGGKRLYLSTGLDWVELYIKHHFQDVDAHAEHYVLRDNGRYALWTGFKRNKVMDAWTELNLGDGFCIYEKHNEYIDCFHFASRLENTGMNDFCLNNLVTLELFVKEFKEKSSEIIDHTDTSKLIVPKKEIYFSDIKYTGFIDEEKIKKFMKQTQFKPHLVS